MAERVAMHEEQRRAPAVADGDDARASRLDLGAGEPFEHVAHDHLRRRLSSPSSLHRALTAAISSGAGHTSGGKRAPSNSGSGSESGFMGAAIKIRFPLAV